MTLNLTQQIIIIATVFLGTVLTRFLPFIIFPPGKPTPKYYEVPWESPTGGGRAFGYLLF